MKRGLLRLVVMAGALVVGGGCGTVGATAAMPSNPLKSFAFCLRGSGGSVDIPARSTVEQNLRDEFLMANPYADRTEVDAHVRTEIDSVLQRELDRRDRQMDSGLQRARSDFLQMKSLLSSVQSVSFKREPLCYVIQSPYSYSGGGLDYDTMCLQEFTLTTTEYRRRTRSPMDKHTDPNFLRGLDESVERRSVHDKVIKPLLGNAASEVSVRSAPDAITCRTWTHGNNLSVYQATPVSG